MGRVGITYLDVAEAASKLREKGLSTTVDGVRSVLGTGSKSTIVPHLRHWKSKQASVIQVTYDELGHQKETSSPRFFELLKELFEQLQTETAIEPEIMGLKGQLYELFRANIASIEARNALEIEKQQLKKEITLLGEIIKSSESDRLFLVQERISLRDELRAIIKT